MTHLEITLQILPQDRAAAATIFHRCKQPFLHQIEGAVSKSLLVRDEDVQVRAFSSAKFALRGLTQALAREHSRDGIHVAHVVIEGLIRGDRTTQRFAQSKPGEYIDAAALAEQYWQLFHQPRSVWTHEVDVRPMPAGA